MQRTPTNVINWLAENLGIEANIRFIGYDEAFGTPPDTTVGSCIRVYDVNCNVRYDIRIRKTGQTPIEMLHVFAHELRHVWQYENNKLTSEYGVWEGVDYIDAVEFHRELPEEIDAEAYADSVIGQLIATFGG